MATTSGEAHETTEQATASTTSQQSHRTHSKDVSRSLDLEEDSKGEWMHSKYVMHVLYMVLRILTVFAKRKGFS